MNRKLFKFIKNFNLNSKNLKLIINKKINKIINQIMNKIYI